MALDYMAIVSYGVYPTPTPTATARAAYAVSYGLLGIVPDYIAPEPGNLGFLWFRMGWFSRLRKGIMRVT